MKQTKIDHLGRFVIPQTYRTQMGLSQGTPISFRYDEENEFLIIEKSKKICLKCFAEHNLILIKEGTYLCSECLHSLKHSES